MEQTDYRSLLREIEAIEQRLGLYLSDEVVDRQNILDADPTAEEKPDFWQRMVTQAIGNAASRAEEAGIDLNSELGRSIC